ncbi:unnamed protein product [Sphenostylis stenocarpa]|uniref:Uncharacterized protein n=1 Tax=Sphenostylis stenocarpa TaxID=92480 RepID=A0AA86T5P4_9FABA|nr:unnamed protein product [Sphenostylis stenocarpa]
MRVRVVWAGDATRWFRVRRRRPSRDLDEGGSIEVACGGVKEMGEKRSWMAGSNEVEMGGNIVRAGLCWWLQHCSKEERVKQCSREGET